MILWIASNDQRYKLLGQITNYTLKTGQAKHAESIMYWFMVHLVSSSLRHSSIRIPGGNQANVCNCLCVSLSKFIFIYLNGRFFIVIFHIFSAKKNRGAVYLRPKITKKKPQTNWHHQNRYWSKPNFSLFWCLFLLSLRVCGLASVNKLPTFRRSEMFSIDQTRCQTGKTWNFLSIIKLMWQTMSCQFYGTAYSFK